MVTFCITRNRRLVVSDVDNQVSLFPEDDKIDFGDVNRVTMLCAIRYILHRRLFYFVEFSSSDFTLRDCEKLLVYLCKIVNTHTTNTSLSVLNFCDFTNKGFVIRPSYFDIAINPQRYEEIC